MTTTATTPSGVRRARNALTLMAKRPDLATPHRPQQLPQVAEVIDTAIRWNA